MMSLMNIVAIKKYCSANKKGQNNEGQNDYVPHEIKQTNDRFCNRFVCFGKQNWKVSKKLCRF